MKAFAFLVIGLFSQSLLSAPPTVIITHASTEWDLHEETKWPALKTLEALKRQYPQDLRIVALQTRGFESKYFLSSVVPPESIVLSRNGELEPDINSPFVLFMGGNFSDCNHLTMQHLLFKWGKNPKLAKGDLDILFVTPGVYDYVRGVSEELAYPEALRETAQKISEQRRARTGMGSPTFRFDWILDQFESDAARAEFLCDRVTRTYDLATSLPEHGVTLEVGEYVKTCSEKKHVLKVNFFYPSAPAHRSLVQSLLDVLTAFGR